MIKNDQISEKKIIAIQALMRSCTAAEAAEAAGVSRVTIYRWLKDDDFQKELSLRKHLIIDGASRKLANSVNKAIDTLIDLNEKSKIPNVRRLAAGNLIDYCLRFSEITDLEKRMTAIEQAIEKKGS